MMTSKIVEKTYDILKKVAGREGIITYDELYDQIGVDMKNSAERKRGSGVLSEINEISVLESSVMITAVVVKNDTQIPGAEFFRVAVTYKTLKEDATDEEKKKFWDEELVRVHEEYK
jgi:hypothetical protein